MDYAVKFYSNSINKVVVGPNNLKYIVGKGGGIQILDDALLPLSTKEESLQIGKMISSYNNPIQQNIVLNFVKNTPLSKLTIQIHDLGGRLMRQDVFDIQQGTVELNTTSLHDGAYFITCMDFQNKIKQTIKIVKSEK